MSDKMTNPAGTPLIELLEREANSLDSWVAKHAGEPDTGKFVALSSSVSILLHSASAELAAAIAERDAFQTAAIVQRDRALQAERTALQLAESLARARALLRDTHDFLDSAIGSGFIEDSDPDRRWHKKREELMKRIDAAAISEAGEGK